MDLNTSENKVIEAYESIKIKYLIRQRILFRCLVVSIILCLLFWVVTMFMKGHMFFITSSLIFVFMFLSIELDCVIQRYGKKIKQCNKLISIILFKEIKHE